MVNRRVEQRGNRNRPAGENMDFGIRNGSPTRAVGSAAAQRNATQTSPNGATFADQGARPKTTIRGAQYSEAASGNAPIDVD